MKKILLIVNAATVAVMLAPIIVVALYYPLYVKAFSYIALMCIMAALGLTLIGWAMNDKLFREIAFAFLIYCGMVIVGYFLACLNVGGWIRFW